MDVERIADLLERVRAGEVGVAAAGRANGPTAYDSALPFSNSYLSTRNWLPKATLNDFVPNKPSKLRDTFTSLVLCPKALRPT